MPDRNLWDRLPDRRSKRLERSGLLVRNIVDLSQYMVSGTIDQAALSAGVNAEGTAALGLASGDRYSVCLARDRLLIVSSQDNILQAGWNDCGYAVSSMSAALEVFEISGPHSNGIVKRATTLPLSGPSPSAAITFAGITGYLYRFQTDDNLRLHVDRGLAAYVWEWLETLLEVATLEP